MNSYWEDVKRKKIGRSYNAKKKKAITAVELTQDGKVKRMRTMRIEDFSAKSVNYMFITIQARTPRQLLTSEEAIDLLPKHMT